MKRIVSILLILVTALYVLPVSNAFMADAKTVCKFIDKNTDDGKDTKKDNGKEFIAADSASYSAKTCKAAMAILPFLSALPVHFTIETPPPDKA